MHAHFLGYYLALAFLGSKRSQRTGSSEHHVESLEELPRMQTSRTWKTLLATQFNTPMFCLMNRISCTRSTGASGLAEAAAYRFNMEGRVQSARRSRSTPSVPLVT